MRPSELLELFRLELDDVAEPYLWSDTEFYVYLNEAQEMFVRQIGGIADRRSSLTKISYKTGDQFRKFDPRILRIKGAFDETNRILTIRNLDNFESGFLEDDYGSRFQSSLDDTKTGSLRYLITDTESNEIQLYPLPDHDGFIRLYVYRLPENTISGASSELEIPSHQHLCLLNWVKYKALLKNDAETFDKSQAAEFRVAFTQDVEYAKREKSSREDRKRTMQYGGIPML
jgi:hypothetical protein